MSWTAPQEGVQAGSATGYEMRIASSAPGTDLEAWWASAVPVSGLPAPAAPGTGQSAWVSGLTPGTPVHAVLRVLDADGVLSAGSPVRTWTPPAAPFLTGLRPNRVAADPASAAFTLTGVGLDGAPAVRFRAANGVAAPGSVTGHDASGNLLVGADLSALPNGALNVEITTTGGTDVLRGWLSLDVAPPPPPPADTLAPATVADLAIEVLGPTRVALTWTAPADASPYGAERAAAYDLRRLGGAPGTWSWDGGTAVPAAAPALPGTAERLVVDGLTPESAVAFAIAALDSAGNRSEASAPAAATLPAFPDTLAPAAITDLAGSVAAGDTVVLSWTVPVDDRGPVASYRVWRVDGDAKSLTTGAAAQLAESWVPLAPGSVESRTVGTVVPGAMASFAVAAVDGAGNVAPPSNPVTVDRRNVDVVAPSLPGSFQASVFNNNTVQLRWLAPGDDGMTGRADHYELRWAADPVLGTAWWDGRPDQPLSGAPKWPGKQEFTNIKGVDARAPLGFVLRAVDEAGNASPWTLAFLNQVSAANADAAPLPAPEGLSARTVTGGVRLAWSPVYSTEVAGYRVYRSHPGQRLVAVASVAGFDTVYVDFRQPDAGLRYAVVAVDAAGSESPLANWVTVAAAAPAGVSVSPDGAGWKLSVEDTPGAGRSGPPAIRIFDVQGRLVAEPEAFRAGGGWEARWNGRTGGGAAAPSGIYFMQVRQGDLIRARKVAIRR